MIGLGLHGELDGYWFCYKLRSSLKERGHAVMNELSWQLRKHGCRLCRSSIRELQLLVCIPNFHGESASK